MTALDMLNRCPCPCLPFEVVEAINAMREKKAYGDVRIVFEGGAIVLVEERKTRKVRKIDATPQA